MLSIMMLLVLIYVVVSLCCSMPHRLRPLVSTVKTLGSTVLHVDISTLKPLDTNTNNIIKPCDCSNHVNTNVDEEKKDNHANNGDVSIELKIIRKKGGLCKHEGCTKHAIFGNEGGEAEYCKKHKQEGMIDVSNPKCIHEGCKTQPSYGNEGGTPEYCAKHKLEGMIDLNSKKCIHKGCKTQPSYGNEGGTREYCKKHFNENHPNESTLSNHGIKENNVILFLQKHVNSPLVIKKQVTRYEPDILIRLEHVVIIIEVDENCHRGKKYSNDEERENKIHIALGLSVIFIRFNPDSYTDKMKQKIKSCWKKNGNRIIEVINETEWNHRLNVLLDTTLSSIANSYSYNSNTKQTIKLFYDNYHHDDSIPHRVNPSHLCKHKGCMERPIFYNEGKRAQYAVDHKAENMVDVLSPTCKHKGCMERPIFYNEGKRAQNAVDRKAENVRNRKAENVLLIVKQRMCKHEGCKKLSIFGYEGGKAEYCSEHKPDDMVDVRYRL